MKNTTMKMFFLACLLGVTSQAQAGLWDDTKETASSAWQQTKETSRDFKEGVVQKWHELTSDTSSPMTEVKKIGDKETYVKAWEGIKESAKHPSKPNVDENGIPKSE